MSLKALLLSFTVSFSSPPECTSTQNRDLLIVTCNTQEQVAELCSLMQTNSSPNPQESCSWNTATLYSPAGWGDSQ